MKRGRFSEEQILSILKKQETGAPAATGKREREVEEAAGRGDAQRNHGK